MTLFQIGVDSESGSVTIWMEAACGLKPILVCADLEGVREFAGMLLDFYNSKKAEKDRIERISENLLRQALTASEDSGRETE